MLYTKDGYPEVNEVVKCTVKRIYGNTTFVNLDEYNKEAVLTISEVAPGRIRNLRDHVVEGKSIICKVLRVIENKNQIDVSLRRVSIPVMKEKVEQLNREKLAEKIYEDISSKLKIDKEELFKKTYEVIFENYDNVYDFLDLILEDEKKVDLFKKLDLDQRKVFKDSVLSWIKPKEVFAKKSIKLISKDSQGLNNIKDVFKDAQSQVDSDQVEIFYLAAGVYQIKVKGKEVKAVNKVKDKIISFIDKNQKKYKVELL